MGMGAGSGVWAAGAGARGTLPYLCCTLGAGAETRLESRIPTKEVYATLYLYFQANMGLVFAAVRAGPLPYLWPPGAPVFQVVRAMRYVRGRLGVT